MLCITAGIYCIENILNGKKYVGKSIHIEERIKTHFRELRKNVHHNKHLQNSYNKYGEENFKWSIIEECSKEDLNEREIWWIKETGAYKNGYNSTLGGEGVSGWVADDDFRNKMRQIVMGKNNPNYNNHWSDEQRERASKRIKESGMYIGVNNPRATRIICIETLEVFDCINQAVDKYGFSNPSSISIALKTRSRVAGNYHFAYYNDDFYSYIKDHQYEYLRECYSESKDATYFEDTTNKIIYKKKELFGNIYRNGSMTTRRVSEIMKQKEFCIDGIQYKLLN